MRFLIGVMSSWCLKSVQMVDLALQGNCVLCYLGVRNRMSRYAF
jgi:hypothetical protein